MIILTKITERHVFMAPAKNGLTFDPEAAVGHLLAADGKLARVIETVGPLAISIDKTKSVFAALSEAIVYQQLSGKAAATIYARLQALFGPAGQILSAQDICLAKDDSLRGVGLSRPKLLALRDLAQKTLDGDIPEMRAIRKMDDGQIIECLTRIRGIGVWSAQMFLIFRLGRPDVMPLGDLGIRKGFAKVYGKRDLPTEAVIEKQSRKWKPYCSAASWYLWRALEI